MLESICTECFQKNSEMKLVIRLGIILIIIFSGSCESRTTSLAKTRSKGIDTTAILQIMLDDSILDKKLSTAYRGKKMRIVSSGVISDKIRLIQNGLDVEFVASDTTDDVGKKWSIPEYNVYVSRVAKLSDGRVTVTLLFKGIGLLARYEMQYSDEWKVDKRFFSRV